MRTDFQKDSAQVKKLVANLKTLPQSDYERLRAKYSLDIKGGINILGMLLGDQIKYKIQKTLEYYKKISPYLNRGGAEEAKEEEIKYVRGKGLDIKFNEPEPFPDFLIRHAKLSMNFPNMRIDGETSGLGLLSRRSGWL